MHCLDLGTFWKDLFFAVASLYKKKGDRFLCILLYSYN